jgi:L-xylulokinase
MLDTVLEIAGQQPAEPSQAAVFAWLCRWEPETAGRIRWLLTAKDWLRVCLTGHVGTDFSEANASFGALDGSGFDARIPDLLGIPPATRLLPPLAAATDLAGAVTPDAARETGLRVGIPGVYGAHDIVAAALGSGIAGERCYCIVAGTWGVNAVLAGDRVIDRRWQSRRWISGEGWLHMSASPASTSNLDWFLRQAQLGDPDMDAVNRQVTSLLDGPVDILFLPFLFGSPEGSAPSAAFLGVRGWHTRADMLRAVFEGVIFNHLMQLDALRGRFGRLPLRLTGGGSRSAAWGQLLADAADATVEIPTVQETGCWGAAICAAVGIGRYRSLSEANLATSGPANRYEPRAHRHAALMEGYGRYRSVLRGLRDMWPLLTPGGTSAGTGTSAGAGVSDVAGDPRDAG